MFEITIRTDNQDALEKLMEILSNLNLQAYKGPLSNGKKLTLEFSEKKANTPSGGEDKEKKIVQWGGMEVDISGIRPGFGCAKGMFEMSPDFDEPPEDFKEYMF